MNSSTSSFEYSMYLTKIVMVTVITLLGHFVILEGFTVLERKKEHTQEFQAIKQIATAGGMTGAVLGTSHLDFLEIPIPGFVNLAKAYTYPTIMYFKIKHIVRHTRPKFLIIEANEHLFYKFSVTSSKRSHSIFVDEPVDETSLGKHHDDSGLFTKHSLDQSIAPIVHRRFFESLASNIGVIHATAGTHAGGSDYWVGLSPRERVAWAKRRLDFFGLHAGSEPQEAMVDYYQRAISLATSQGIHVVLLRTPRSKEYLDEMPPEISMTVSRLLDVYEANPKATVFDCRRLYEVKNEMFNDGDHLSQAVLDEFSLYLRDRLKREGIL